MTTGTTGLAPFGITLPGRIIFGRGEAAKTPEILAGSGGSGLLVHGATSSRAAWLSDGLRALGLRIQTIACEGEPTLAMLEGALEKARAARPAWVAALGGGAAIDLGKALAALIPAPGAPMDHLEVVGRGLPLGPDPLPFIAIPTTAGTGAEATRNAVIGLPEHGRKVSLRDPRMLPQLAIVDPALTDGCPRAVTLASGLDALAQVIEPYVSCRATPFTDALSLPAISSGMAALMVLMEREDRAARDVMAWVSLSGGLALANGGLGAAHGLAGVIGGIAPAAHGAICGALLGPVLAANRAHAEGVGARRLDEICGQLAAPLGCAPKEAPEVLARWARAAGLPGLTAQGLAPDLYPQVAQASASSSSMKGNPVSLPVTELEAVLARAA